MSIDYRTPPFAPTGNTYDQNGTLLEPFTPTVVRLPVPDEDMPTVTVQGRFDWRFWGGVLLAVSAGYILLKSMQRAARHG